MAYTHGRSSTSEDAQEMMRNSKASGCVFIVIYRKSTKSIFNRFIFVETIIDDSTYAT